MVALHEGIKMSTPKNRKGRTLNESKDAHLDIHLNVGQAKAINLLVKSGLWGNTAAACTMRLIDDGILRHSK